MTIRETALYAAELLRAENVMRDMLDENEDDFTDPDTVAMLKCVRDAVSQVESDFAILREKKIAAKSAAVPAEELGMPDIVRAVKDRYGRVVRFTFDSRGLIVDSPGEYTVVYTCAPKPVSDIDANIEFAPCVRPSMLGYLAACNYCIMAGRTDEANIFLSRYDRAAEGIRITRRSRLPRRAFL